MQASFTPAGTWFVFDEETGRTKRRNFISAQQAFDWINQQRIRASSKTQPSQGVLAHGNH